MKSVKIGNQEWSSENLNVDHFNNGDEIHYITQDQINQALADNFINDWEKEFYENNIGKT